MARIAVFGASGRTGLEVLRYAVDRGHRVVAVSRDPSRVPNLTGVDVRRGDVLDPASLTGVLDGVDVVVSALGPDGGRRPTSVYSRGARAITSEMRSARLRRIVVVSAVPVSANAEKTRFERLVLHPVLWHFFGASYRDLRVMETELAAAHGLDWVVVRPPLLTDDSVDRPLRTALNAPLRGTRKVSRRMLARTLVDTVTAEEVRTGILTITQA